ncbi:hypothetical protein COY27_04395 [Candidatus Woesearchaeota archaeon CG_4_10_14_0_2_um_filter_33_13]|nr:MAG: hypothetical protein COY27_04395 [Candidatus Woesearchaeota archaeon CG_4_10_14_0_2_um_filter_33_13]
MAEKTQHHDFIEVDYTGRLTDGTVFDTTVENVAKEAGLPTDKVKYAPAVVCIGEKQILPGLDHSLENQEIGKSVTVNLKPEQAFGKRDVKNLRIVPMNTFKEHKVQPQPGLQIDVDGQMGTIVRVSGGRVIVNFNHPLAGKEVVYEVTIKRRLTDVGEKLVSFLNSTFRIPSDKINVEVKEDKAEVRLPVQFPEQIAKEIAKKLADVVQLKEVKFVNSVATKPGEK